jgi:ketosteroid isomerase-like protein
MSEVALAVDSHQPCTPYRLDAKPEGSTVLQVLVDRATIVDTVIAYATAVDTRDWAKLGALFTDDAVWEHTASGLRYVGPDAIVAGISAGVARLDATQHLNGNHVIAVDRDGAEHTSYFHAQHVRAGERFLAGGRYDDRLRRTPGGWHIAQRRVTSVWSEGNPAVLAR